MAKCCSEAVFETEHRLELRVCNDLCTDSDFLLKLISLMLIILALLLPIYMGVSIFLTDMSINMIYMLSNLFYSSAYGALIALIVLVVLVLVDEDHQFISFFFLFVYSVLLICSTITILTYLSQHSRNNTSDGLHNDTQPLEPGGTPKWRPIDLRTTTSPTAVSEEKPSGNYPEYVDKELPYASRGPTTNNLTRYKRDAQPSNTITTIPTDYNNNTNHDYNTANNDNKNITPRSDSVNLTSPEKQEPDKTTKKNKNDSLTILYSTLLLIAGILMMLDLGLECCYRQEYYG